MAICLIFKLTMAVSPENQKYYQQTPVGDTANLREAVTNNATKA